MKIKENYNKNFRLATKSFQDKISQLQFQLANRSIKGRKNLSNDEFDWLLKHIEEDEDFYFRKYSYFHYYLEVFKHYWANYQRFRRNKSKSEPIDILEEWDQSYLKDKELEDEIIKSQEEL